MSELQAVFKARNKNRASTGEDDNNSEYAIVPELQSNNAPSQTVTSSSAETSRPYKASTFSAMDWRKAGIPAIGAY